jgi:hypothetical protein
LALFRITANSDLEINFCAKRNKTFCGFFNYFKYQASFLVGTIIIKLRKTGKNAGKSEKGKTFWFFQVVSFSIQLKITPEIEKVKILAWF